LDWWSGFKVKDLSSSPSTAKKERKKRKEKRNNPTLKTKKA
jgi:hypothetical protein